jgi:hypothetical protein
MSDIDISRLTPKSNDIATVTMKRATNVRRAGILFSTFEHVLEIGDDWRIALDRTYWLGCLDKLIPGSTVVCHSADHAIRWELLVIDSNTAAGYLHMAFRPIWPPDLELPQPPLQVPPHFGVREAPGGGAFRVHHLATGAPVSPGDNKDRRGAEEQAAQLERAYVASTVQLANAFAQHQAERAVTDVTDEESVTAGALRTRKYRERQRATGTAS